jgi:pSer/pThr/pTyr-binding forkhead associated (FHA) protein
VQELVLFLLRVGFLVLLWAFVIAAIVVVRNDMFGARAARAPRTATAPRTAPARPAKPAKAGRRSNARRLVVTEGPLAGTSIPLADTPVTIGRADDSTLVVNDDYVSSRHARLVPRGDSWVVEDMGSTNGTYLDRTKVSRPTPVPLGTSIRVGKTVMELRR